MEISINIRKRVFFSKFPTFFSRNFLIFHIFLGFFSKYWNVEIFLVLENFTNSDRTPPYIDTYLQLFPNLEIMEKTPSDKNEPKNDFFFF